MTIDAWMQHPTHRLAYTSRRIPPELITSRYLEGKARTVFAL